jgi:hypothetical protein
VFAKSVRKLADEALALDPSTIAAPKTMTDDEFFTFLQGRT